MKIQRIFLLAACLLAGVCAGALSLTRPGQLDDAAGVPGKRGYSGDGGDALQARLGSPMGIAVDGRGNIYFSDTVNHRVRMVNARTGQIDTVVGTGKKGFDNDGGNAEMAALNTPTGLAFDTLGNLYIADTGNHRVRVFTPKGYLYTIAGDGRKGYNGNGMRPLASSLKDPTAVAVSPQGELYISDTGNHRIRKIDRQSGFLVDVVGTGEAGDSGDLELAENARLNSPSAIVFDKWGNLFIADTGNHQVRWVEPRRHLIFTIAGTGKRGFSGEGDRKCTDSAFSNPTGLAIDKEGRLYIADTDNQRIRRLTVESRMDSKVVTVVGSGERGYNGDGIDAWDAKLAYPGALVITRHDMLFFADTGNNLIRRVQGISTVEPPVKCTGYGQADAQPDDRNFLEVLFGSKKTAQPASSAPAKKTSGAAAPSGAARTQTSASPTGSVQKTASDAAGPVPSASAAR